MTEQTEIECPCSIPTCGCETGESCPCGDACDCSGGCGCHPKNHCGCATAKSK